MKYSILKRLIDITLSIFLIFMTLVPMLIISIFIYIDSGAPIFHLSDRAGINNYRFKMLKFRSMKLNSPQLATHLIVDPKLYVTSIGRRLRKYSLDELPQLFNILIGDMSFVGPRPALFNQYELIFLRSVEGVNSILPGLTGAAQINGRDELTIHKKCEYDKYYLKNMSLMLDIKIIIKTICLVFSGKNVAH